MSSDPIRSAGSAHYLSSGGSPSSSPVPANGLWSLPPSECKVYTPGLFADAMVRAIDPDPNEEERFHETL